MLGTRVARSPFFLNLRKVRNVWNFELARIQEVQNLIFYIEMKVVLEIMQIFKLDQARRQTLL